MITGVVTPDREAVIRLVIRGPRADECEIAAVIDTGFNRHLTLPPQMVQSLGLRRIGPVQATLADGSVRMLVFYRAFVVWDQGPIEVSVLDCEGVSLIGMSMLYGHELRIQVVDGGEVWMEPLP